MGKIKSYYDIQRKGDVEKRGNTVFSHGHPCLNVKAQNVGWDLYNIAERFKCSEAVAEQAAQYVWDSNAEEFWEDAKQVAEDVFGEGVEVYSEGRSGGWPVVHGLYSVDEWDAIDLGKWRQFAKQIGYLMLDATDRDHAFESIECNRWAEEGAERFNMFERSDGESHCIVDAKNGFPDLVGVDGAGI